MTMGTVLQYSIKAINQVLKEYVKSFELLKEYSPKDLDNIYDELKGYETKKTSKGFVNILNSCIFTKLESNNFRLSEWGILLKKNRDNLKILKERIHLYQYHNRSIYRVESNIILEYLDLNFSFPLNKSAFKEFMCEKITEALKETKFEKNVKNATNKMGNVINNLIQLGIIREAEGQKVIEINYYKPEWQIFGILLLNEFLPEQKVDFQRIVSSDFRKSLFMSKNDVLKYLDSLEENGVIMLENQAGLMQIHINYRKTYDMVKSL